VLFSRSSHQIFPVHPFKKARLSHAKRVKISHFGFFNV